MRIVVLFPTVEEAKCFLLSEPHVPVFISGRGPVQTAAAVVRAVKARKPHLVVLAGTAAACDRMLPLGEAVEVTSRFEAELAAAERRIYRTDPATDLPEATGCSAQTAVQCAGCDIRAKETAETDAEAAAGFPTTGDDLSDDTPVSAAEAAAGDPFASGPHAEAAEEYDPPTCCGFYAADDLPTAGSSPRGDTSAAGPGAVVCSSGGVPSSFRSASARGAHPQVVSREGAALTAVCEALGVRCCEIRVASHYAGEAPSPEALAHAAERLTETLNEIFENHEQK